MRFPKLVGSAGLLAVTILSLWAGDNRVAPVSVAFVGNSFQYVNDLPRMMEAISQGRIQQDSVLHGSLSFVSLLQKGNGMTGRWNSTNTYNDDGSLDFGSCTVRQLLLGYDDQLANFEDYYVVDGKNPCFENPDYLDYQESIATRRSSWDYVFLNDQSIRPVYEGKRYKSAQALQEEYAPLILSSGATPILFMTWGYWRDDYQNMTDVVDVPTFTSILYQAYNEYAEVLDSVLPSRQKSKLAPVGLAFLLVYEENPAFWQTLFGKDSFHPSPSGSYLLACVLYATIYNQLPPISATYNSSELWTRARRMQIETDYDPHLPTTDEALYLRWIAKRVALEGQKPKSLVYDIEYAY